MKQKHKHLPLRFFLFVLILLSPQFLRIIFPPLSASVIFFLYNFLLLFIMVLSTIWLIVALIQTMYFKLIKKKPLPLFAKLGYSAALACVIVFFITPLFMSDLPSRSHELKFDQKLWNDDSIKFDDKFDDLVSVKQRMLGDVVKNILPGKCKDEIISLLGQPEGRSHLSSDKDLIIWLGTERDSFFRIDSELLYIELDEKQCFKDYAIRVD